MQGVRGSSPRSSTNRDETADPSPLAGAAGGDLSPRNHVTETTETDRATETSDARAGSSATTRPRSSRAGRRAGPSSGCTRRTSTTSRGRKFYLLTMYPYPSGDLHIGHWYIKTPTDAIARFQRMHGENVFLPIGFDAFGLPAENAAIKSGIHPRDWTMSNIENMRRQLRTMGATFDWEAEVVTADPDYYRWNQWFFLRFLKAGLAYRADVAGRLVPQRRDARARAGRGRRPPLLALRREGREARPRAVVPAVTKYADELLDFSGLDWPEPIKTQQTNWIGRSEGGEIVFDDRPSPSTSRAAPSCASSRPARTRCSGRRSWSSPPSTRSSRS